MKLKPIAQAWLAPGLLVGATLTAVLLSMPAKSTNAANAQWDRARPLTAVSGSTSGALCSYSESTPVVVGNNQSFTSTASWSCSGSQRMLSGNGIPNHATGTFPSTDDPNAISAQTVTASLPLSPAQAASTTQVSHIIGYALNSVKFDPATAGGCTVTNGTTSCVMIGNTGAWSLEALGQTTFKFGADSSNAHTQPDGSYHYHGMPEGLITKLGKGQAMTLVGWAGDGFPIYARYGYTEAANAGSAIKVMKSSYQLKTTPDSGRPSVSSYPMGTFTQDYEYVAGSGDLDDCNGRIGVTPEFPNGIYHYYVTDTYPYVQRCVKGTSTIPSGPGGTTGGGSSGSFSASLSAAGTLTLQSLVGGVNVSSTDSGKAGSLFAAALVGKTLYLMSSSGWQAYNPASPVAYSSGTLASNSNISLTGGALDLTSLKGGTVMLGYGRGSTVSAALSDLVANNLYSTVYTIQ